jgi:iron complex outermembrane receptor protein
MGTTHTIGTPAPPYAGGQVAQGGTLGLLGSRSVMNTPFSTTNYTSQLIENQQARTAADTLINNASVRATTGQNGFDDTLQIRGFPVPASDIGLNGLYGLVSSNRVPSYFVERIELLLGPGALINGIAPGGSVGGGVNIVTKRAALLLSDFAPVERSERSARHTRRSAQHADGQAGQGSFLAELDATLEARAVSADLERVIVAAKT